MLCRRSVRCFSNCKAQYCKIASHESESQSFFSAPLLGAEFQLARLIALDALEATPKNASLQTPRDDSPSSLVKSVLYSSCTASTPPLATHTITFLVNHPGMRTLPPMVSHLAIAGIEELLVFHFASSFSASLMADMPTLHFAFGKQVDLFSKRSCF